MLVSIIEFIKDFFKYLIVIGIIILIRIFAISTAEVVGPSMEPNYGNGNIFLVEMISTKLNIINRFDLIVIKYSNPKYIVKRVIGLPGETISFKNNKLFINDILTKQDFDYLGVVEDFSITIPENQYFVMGDNRDDSIDSRIIGPIFEKDIYGKSIIIVYPLGKNQ